MPKSPGSQGIRATRLDDGIALVLSSSTESTRPEGISFVVGLHQPEIVISRAERPGIPRQGEAAVARLYDG